MALSRHGLWLAAIATALVLIAAGLFWPEPEREPQGHPILPTAPAPGGGAIALPVSSTGAPFRLEDYRGRYLWVYFGYTSCPDACPVSLAWISGALSRLPAELRGEVGGLFVSVDPERDSGERLREYAAHFHPDVIAATGPHPLLREIAARYGVFYRHTEVDSALGYVVDHSSSTYLVGPEGSLLEVHPHGTTATELLAALEAHASRRHALPGTPAVHE
jgi:protein SCO1